MKRFLARLGTFALAASLLAHAGCDDMLLDGDAGGPIPDSGRMTSPDGGFGFFDGAAPADAGARLSDESLAPDGCSDGTDNDVDGNTDCADVACNQTPVCCLGSLRGECCSGDTVDITLEPAACPDGALSSCSLEPGVTAFGATAPVIENQTLVPQGMPAYAGLQLGDAVDLRGNRVELTATVRVPETRCDGCVDASGIALVAPADFTGALNYLRLAVLVIGATEEVALVVNGEVVDSRGFEAPGDIDLRLGSGDDGGLVYSLGSGEQALPDLNLPSALVPTVLGQNENRAGEAAISIVAAKRALSTCSVPSAIAPRATPVYPSATSTHEPGLGLGRISVVQREDERLAVVEVDGSLHALQANMNGEFVPIGGSAEPGTLVVEGTAARHVSAPWLELAVEGFQLFYVATESDGRTQLIRSFFSSLSADREEGMNVILDSETLGVDRIGAATHLEEANLLIAEIEDDSGVHLERFGMTADGLSWTRAGSVATTHADDVFAFDRDFVGEPSLVRHGDVLRLYFTGHRGTRRSIGLLVSSEGTAWRSMGEVLSPSAQGFDSLQVSAPSPLVESEGVSLYYLGRGGSERRIGVARSLGTMGE